MKRVLLGVTIIGAASVLAGCPIYSDSGNYRVCNSSGCFDCPDTTVSSACGPWQCNTDADCGSGYSCIDSSCVLPTPIDAGSSSSSSQSPSQTAQWCSGPSDCPIGSVCGWDNACHVGDCGTWSCPPAYTCLLANGAAQCVLSSEFSAEDASVAADSGDGAPQADADAASHGDAMSATDATDAADGPVNDSSAADALANGSDAGTSD